MDDEMLDVGEESFDEPISESYDEPEIFEESEIIDEIEIIEDPEIIDESEIIEEPELVEDTEITEELEIIEDTEITEESEITEEPEIIEDTEIIEEPEIAEDAEITDESEIIDETEITEEPEIIEDTGIPEDPEIIEDTGIPEDPEITEDTEITEDPEIIEDTEIIEEPEIIEETEIPEDPEIIEDTEIPEDSEIIDETEITEDPEIIEDTEIIEEPEIIEDTEIIEESEIIEDTEITEESEIIEDTEITEESEIIENTEITEDLEIIEDTEITEEPEIIEDTEITEEPEIIDELEIIEEPEIIEDTEIPEESEIAAPTESIADNVTYNNLSDYLSAHNYGKDDYDTYSQDPEWRRLMQIEYPETELPPLTQETIDDILSPYEGKTYDSIAEYYGDHNFGQGDYEIYSQDREWRRLMQQEHPEVELPPLSQEKIDSILAEFEGKSYDSIAEYINDHQFAPSDYEIYSQDPEWRRLMEIEYPEAELPPLHTQSELVDISDRIVDGRLDMSDEEMIQTYSASIDYINEGISNRPIDFESESLNSTLDNFIQENWDNLSLDEQKGAMSELALSVQETIGFENPPQIEYYNNPDPSDYGGYCAETNTLSVNEYNLDDSNEAADTIAHELWHAHQHECANNPQSIRDYQYLHNLDFGSGNYIRPEWDFDGYQAQLVEAEARAFADQYKGQINILRGKR